MEAVAVTLTWNEEVELHDGKKLMVVRSQVLDGNREIGQLGPIREQSIKINQPVEYRALPEWRSEFSKEIGHSPLHPILLEVVDGVVYLVAVPMGCNAYNLLGRPNPPYLVNVLEGSIWRVASMRQLPSQVGRANLTINTAQVERIHHEMKAKGFVSSESVRILNSGREKDSDQSEVKRQPIVGAISGRGSASLVDCPERVYYKGIWVAPNSKFGRALADKLSK